MSRLRLGSAMACGVWAGCTPTAGPSPCEAGLDPAEPVGSGQNVVVVLADDLGVERFGTHPDATRPVPVPTFDSLAERGLQFDAAYADPTCSPTRASLLTGRRPRRHGIGRFVDSRDPDQNGLPDAAVTIPEMLRESPLGPWSTAIIGKWHLDAFSTPRAPFGPLDQGFDTFRGTLGNPTAAVSLSREPELGYTRWEYDVDGELSERTDYLTTVTTDDAITAVRTLPEPFFLYVPYHAGHAPFHLPPPELLPGPPLSADASEPELQDAMLQALDHELGRFLAEVDLTDTLLVVLSDNGSPEETIPGRNEGHKSTVREGGVHVPMWVAGPGVERVGEGSRALVYVADVFATVADVAGVDLRQWPELLDGRSLLPLLSGPEPEWRPCLVAEQFPVNGEPQRATDLSIRDPDEHLVVQRAGRNKEYRDLGADRLGEESGWRQRDWGDADVDAFRQLRRWLREDVRVVR